MTVVLPSIMLMAGLAALACGLDTGVIASTLPYLTSSEGLSIHQVSCVAGAVMAGLFVLTPIGGMLAERLGSKITVMAGAALDVLSAVLLLLAHGHYVALLAARGMAGAGLALLYVAVPLCLAENLPEDRRGRGLAMFNMMVSVGLVLGALSGFVVTAAVGPASEAPARTALLAWRGPYLISALFSCALLVVAVVQKNDHLECQTVGAELGTDVRGMLFKSMLVALVFGVATQLTGISAVLNYPLFLLERAGLTGLSANGVDVVTKGTYAVVSAVAFLMLKWLGPRKLLLVGILGTLAGLVFAAVSFGLIECMGMRPSYLIGCSLAFAFTVFMVFFAFGPGYGVWLALPLMLPSRHRAKCMCSAIFVNYLCGWAMTTFFLPISEGVGMTGMFGALAILTGLYAIFSWKSIPVELR